MIINVNVFMNKGKLFSSLEGFCKIHFIVQAYVGGGTQIKQHTTQKWSIWDICFFFFTAILLYRPSLSSWGVTANDNSHAKHLLFQHEQWPEMMGPLVLISIPCVYFIFLNFKLNFKKRKWPKQSLCEFCYLSPVFRINFSLKNEICLFKIFDTSFNILES